MIKIIVQIRVMMMEMYIFHRGWLDRSQTGPKIFVVRVKFNNIGIVDDGLDVQNEGRIFFAEIF